VAHARSPAPGSPGRCDAPDATDAVGLGGAGRPRVGVVGAGRVGSSLGAALAAAGYPVLAVTALSPASRARAAALLPGVPVHPDPAAVARVADVLLVAVGDDALADLVAGLAASGALRPGQTVVHTSGAHGLAVLAPAAAVEARVLALHPAMTFTGTTADSDRLPGCRWGVTGESALAGRLVADLGGVVVPIAERDRPAYHAALAHGANHLVTLVVQAAEVLHAAGVTDTDGMLRPLLSAALDGALTHGEAATTGPAVRGDAASVAAHLGVLPASTLPSYAALARDTARRAAARGVLPVAAADAVLAALDAASVPA